MIITSNIQQRLSDLFQEKQEENRLFDACNRLIARYKKRKWKFLYRGKIKRLEKIREGACVFYKKYMHEEERIYREFL